MAFFFSGTRKDMYARSPSLNSFSLSTNFTVAPQSCRLAPSLPEHPSSVPACGSGDCCSSAVVDRLDGLERKVGSLGNDLTKLATKRPTAYDPGKIRKAHRADVRSLHKLISDLSLRVHALEQVVGAQAAALGQIQIVANQLQETTQPQLDALQTLAAAHAGQLLEHAGELVSHGAKHAEVHGVLGELFGAQLETT